MDFLLKPALTIRLFGGLDVCWLALILLAAAAVVEAYVTPLVASLFL